MLAVEEAAQAAGQTCSQWLREAALAHLKRPVRSRRSMPDPTLLTELMGLRQLTVNLFAAVAGNSISHDQVREIVRQADHVKESKADDVLASAPRRDGGEVIRLSRRTELIHPVRTMLFYGAQMLVYLGIVTALGWGWGQLRFSPIQWYYFGAYAEASFGVATGSSADRAWQIADPDDLVPASAGVAPFALSESARSQGWSDLGYDSSGTYPEREIRNFLQADVFDGHSLPFLILQPFAFLFAGWLCLKFFDHWRKGEARDRGAGWDPEYRPDTLFQDLRLFSRHVSREVKAKANRIRSSVASWRKLQAEAVPGATVSPSGMAQRATAIPEKSAAPTAVSVAKPIPVQQARPAASSLLPRPSKGPKGKTVEPESKPKPVAVSPFGKPVAEGRAETKWDISKWIE